VHSPAAQAPTPNPDPVFPVRARPDGDTSWRERIGSSDPSERVEAVDAVPYAPGADGVALLEEILRSDPNEEVRERAVMAFTQALGNAALPVLREVGRAERGTDVGAAVRASMQLIDEYDPLPRRSSMEIGTTSAPSRLGEWFPVTFRLRSEQAVPDARLSLSGKGLRAAGNRSRVWKGALEAGQVHEIEGEDILSPGPSLMLGLRRIHEIIQAFQAG
jgi:hypothetical protein